VYLNAGTLVLDALNWGKVGGFMLDAVLPFAEQLHQARRLRGLSQRALAAKIGITQSHLSRIEKGTVDLQLSTLLDLARVLELDVMIIPRGLVPAVHALTCGIRPDSGPPPKYALEDADN